MSEWKPLFISLGILLIIGIFMPLIVLPFATLEDAEPTGFLGEVNNFVQNGVDVTLFNVTFFGAEFDTITNFDVFDFLGETARNYFSDLIVTFNIVPAIITIPLLVIVIVGIVYTTLKTLPTT